MSYFAKLAKLGFMVVCRANRLNSTTMFAVRDEDYEIGNECLYNKASDMECWDIDDLLDALPEWRLVDFVGDEAAKGARMLYEKLTCTGGYAKWDERLGAVMGEDDKSVLIGFEHRPESERYRPVAD